MHMRSTSKKQQHTNQITRGVLEVLEAQMVTGLAQDKVPPLPRLDRAA
jgi:hypothetical protein